MKRILTVLLFLGSIEVYAQEEENNELKQKSSGSEVGSIATDRPVNSETPTVVPKKYFQTELGAYYERGNEHGKFRNDNTYVPNALIKYGLVKNLELRFAFDYLTVNSINTIQGKEVKDSESSMTDPTMGIKYSFLQAEEEGLNLTLSLQSQVGLWASEGFKQEEENWQGRLTAGYNLTENWYMLGGLGYYYYESSTSNLFYVWQTGYSFGNLTALIEYYGYSNEDNDVSAINAALVYLIANDHQVDVSFGKGLDDDFYDYYVALGYSFRIGF